MQKTSVAAGNLKKAIGPIAGNAAVRIKNVTNDVWEYVYRKVARPG